MIVNKEKTIKFIADFLSDYISKTSLKNFWIKDHIHPNDDILIKICELARAKCGAEVLVSWTIPMSPWPYSFARTRTKEDDMSKCLIVSPLSRSEGIINRSFKKHKNIADVYPLLDLYRSEICQLTNAPISEKDEEEYIDRENSKNGIIVSDQSPIKHPDWYRYTKTQKDLIAKLHAREKATRHKDLLSRGAVYPLIRDTGYVR